MPNILHIIDIETNSLDTFAGDIIEVGYIKITDDLKIVGYGNHRLWEDAFEDKNWSVGATDVHGLTKDMLRETGEPINIFLPRLYTLINNALVVGKNSNAFDIPFIKRYIARKAFILNGFEPRNTIEVQKHCGAVYREWYLKEHGINTRRVGTLAEQCAVCGITNDMINDVCRNQLNVKEEDLRFHSALYDSAATYLLLCYIVRERGLSIRV